jgi:hypothetical protein
MAVYDTNTIVSGTAGSTILSALPAFSTGNSSLDIQLNRLCQFVADNLATVSAQQTAEFGTAGAKVRSGAETFTGSVTDVVTGLSTVTKIVASVVDTNPTTAGDALVVTVGLNATAGEIDLYAWKNTAGTIAAATNACTVHWIAWGT